MSVAKVASPTSSFLNDDFIRRTISNLLPKLSAWNLCTARASVTESTEAIERAQLRVGRGKPHLPVLLGTVVESPGYGQRRDHRSSVRLRFAMTSLSASAYASVMESFFREEREIASATPIQLMLPLAGIFGCEVSAHRSVTSSRFGKYSLAARISSEVGARCDIGR